MSLIVAAKRSWLFLILIMMFMSSGCIETSEAACTPRSGCSRALAYYTVTQGDQLHTLVDRFQTNISDLQNYNNIANIDVIQSGNYILFPFPCQCVDDLLGYSYMYEVIQDDTLNTIVSRDYQYLTTVLWMTTANNLPVSSTIFPGLNLKIPVNCSCGNPDVSPLYGLFTTYPVQSMDNGSYLATKFGIDEDLLRQYNPSANWNGSLSQGDIIFIPSQEASTGLFPPFKGSDHGTGKENKSLVVGVSVGGVVALLVIMLLFCLFCVYRKGQQMEKHYDLEVVPLDVRYGSKGGSGESGKVKFSSGDIHEGLSPGGLSDFTVDKSVEFSFEELAAATNNFSVTNKIGEGGYAAVYYAYIRGQKLAVKRMNLQATREFLAELQVLTHVHHTNLVQLIGYCTVGSLFLIYEYVENGTLDRHLRGSHDRPPLTWAARVEIALDSARGLEYIHEHTRPTYIHRDVKSCNILIDKHFHAKVADFGLTKLTETGSASLTMPTRLVGTFGYMSPEYARYGDVSPKVDVYAFGVVLFEIISAKEAIVRSIGSTGMDEQRGLVTLFEEVLRDRDARENFSHLVDPALGTNYPLESVWKMAQLAGACTEENPELRPSMRAVVVALQTLSSSTQEWEMTAYGTDRIMAELMSGR